MIKNPEISDSKISNLKIITIGTNFILQLWTVGTNRPFPSITNTVLCLLKPDSRWIRGVQILIIIRIKVISQDTTRIIRIINFTLSLISSYSMITPWIMLKDNHQ